MALDFEKFDEIKKLYEEALRLEKERKDFELRETQLKADKKPQDETFRLEKERKESELREAQEKIEKKLYEEASRLEKERKDRELRETREKERKIYGDIPKDVFEFMLKKICGLEKSIFDRSHHISDITKLPSGVHIPHITKLPSGISTPRNLTIIKDVDPEPHPEKAFSKDFMLSDLYYLNQESALQPFIAGIKGYSLHKFTLVFPVKMQLYHIPSEPPVDPDKSVAFLRVDMNGDKFVLKGCTIRGEDCPQEVLYAKIRDLCHMFDNNKQVISYVFASAASDSPYTLNALEKSGQIQSI